MSWFPVARFSISADLQLLNRLLQVQGVEHRFTEEQGEQILWVLGEDSARSIREHFIEDSEWYLKSPSINTAKTDLEEGGQQQTRYGRQFCALLGRYPVSLLLIIGGVLGALLVALDPRLHWVGMLTSQTIVLDGRFTSFGTLPGSLQAGQWWRLITPIFLHFGALHIIFNALWLWEFGRRAESSLGSSYYLSYVILIALGSNTLQYFWQGPSLFGGLSGVVFGLLGLVWMRQYFYPDTITPVRQSVINILIGYLFVCMTGVFNFFIGGQVANAAHIGGLVIGMLIGMVPIKTTGLRV